MHYTKSLQSAPRRIEKRELPVWQKRLPYWLFLFAFAFDFKGGFARSGSVDQILSVVVFLGSLIWILAKKRRNPVPKEFSYATICWFTIVLLGTFATIVTVLPPPYGNEAPVDSFIVSLPFLIVGGVLLMSQTIYGTGMNWSNLRKPLLLSALFNALAQGVFGLFISGSSVDKIRGEATSYSNLFLFAIGFMEVFVPGLEMDALSFISLFTSVFFLGLSIDRGFLITAVLVIMFTTFMVFRMRKAKGIRGFGRQVILRALTLIVLLVLCFSGLVALRPNVFNTWQLRLSRMLDPNVQNSENTPAIRMAQYEYSARVIEQDPLKFATGVGFWRNYPIIGSRNRFSLTSGQTFDDFSTADSLWYFPFLTSGVIGGSLFVALYAVVFFYAVKKLLRLHLVPANLRWQTCAGIAMFTVISASTASGNGLYVRFWSLMFGICIALMLSPTKEPAQETSVSALAS